MTDEEIVLALSYVAEAWPHYVLPTRPDQLEVRISVWRDQLADVDAGLVRAAIATCDGDHAPSPKQLRTMALQYAGVQLPPDADAAIAEIQTAVRRYGYTWLPSWSHPAIGDTVEAFGGWLEVCKSRNPEACRAHLLKLYDVAAKRHRRRETLSPAFAGLLPSVDDPQAIGGPPDESVSALRSPVVEERNDAEHLRRLADVWAEVERARAARDAEAEP